MKKIRFQRTMYTFALILIFANVYIFYLQIDSPKNDSVQHKSGAVIEANIDVVNEVDPKQVFSDGLPERSDIRLLQIIQSDTESVAWFAINERKAQAFMAQQQITEHILLDKIESDRVQIKYLVNKELILLESQESQVGTAFLKKDSSSIVTPVNAITQDKRLAAFPLGVVSDGVKQLQVNQYVIDRNQVNQQLSQGNVFRHAKFERQEEGGFKFTEIAENSLYDKIGLQEGDIVQQINGQSINDLTDVMLIYEQYSQQDQAQLMINRNGQNEFIYFMLQN